MAKDFAVDFRGRVPRIIKNAADIIALEGEPSVVFNPDLSLVKGVSPSFWKLNVSGTIVPVEPGSVIQIEKMSMRDAGINNMVEKVDFSTVRDEIDSKLKIILSSQGPVIKGIQRELTYIKSLLRLAAILLVSISVYLVVKGVS